MTEYWENRYQTGGTSGSGSIGASRDFKWRFIEDRIGPIEQYRDRVLDVGCGDLSFWEGRSVQSYTGIDLSQTAITRNRERRASWNFVQGDASQLEGLDGECVLCLDFLFHVMDDDTYAKVVRNLGRWTRQWLFIHTWHKNPLTKVGLLQRSSNRTKDSYQAFRPLAESFGVLREEGLELASSSLNPHNQYGTIYAFNRTV